MQCENDTIREKEQSFCGCSLRGYCLWCGCPHEMRNDETIKIQL